MRYRREGKTGKLYTRRTLPGFHPSRPSRRRMTAYHRRAWRSRSLAGSSKFAYPGHRSPPVWVVVSVVLTSGCGPSEKWRDDTSMSAIGVTAEEYALPE